MKKVKYNNTIKPSYNFILYIVIYNLYIIINNLYIINHNLLLGCLPSSTYVITLICFSLEFAIVTCFSCEGQLNPGDFDQLGAFLAEVDVTKDWDRRPQLEHVNIHDAYAHR